MRGQKPGPGHLPHANRLIYKHVLPGYFTKQCTNKVMKINAPERRDYQPLTTSLIINQRQWVAGLATAASHHSHQERFFPR